MKRWRKIILATGAMLLIGVVAVGAVSLAAADETTNSGAPATPRKLPTMTFEEQTTLFPVLAQPSTTADRDLIPSAEAMAASGAEEPEPIVMDAQKVRQVATAGEFDVGLIPSQVGVCMMITPGPGSLSGSCIPKESIEEVGVNISLERDGEYYLLGALPNSWSRQISVVMNDGSVSSVPVNDDGAYAFVSSDQPAEIVRTDGNGTEHRAPQKWGGGSAVVGSSEAR